MSLALKVLFVLIRKADFRHDMYALLALFLLALSPGADVGAFHVFGTMPCPFKDLTTVMSTNVVEPNAS